MESINILYVVMVFVFLKYGLRDLNLIYFILLSVGIVYLVKSNKVLDFKKKDKIAIDNQILVLLNKLEKYDNNNLLLLVKSNITNLNRYLIKKDTFITMDLNDMNLLTSKIYNYIDSLNMAHNDIVINNVNEAISKILDRKIRYYKKKNNIL
tara:strand:+ start:377 stop:832 length:456 start_codon:yes stop_codon:yes gene_type:complete